MPGRFDQLLRQAKPQDHNPAMLHREAFCLMWYACHCGHRERIWNSRDGVTPFCTLCPSCKSPTLQHVDFGRDEFAPEHKPGIGQRVWLDMTRERAEVIAKRRMDAFRAAGREVNADVLPSLIDSLMGIEHGGGAPDMRIHGYEST